MSVCSWERWESLFLKHFSRSRLSKSSQLYHDVCCVVLGLKPALLVDYVPSRPPKLQLFLEEAIWSSRKLCILSLGGDVLFVNQTSLTLSRNRPVFINISRSLGKPEILSTEGALCMAKTPFSCCCGLLDRALLDHREESIPIIEYSPHSDHPDCSIGDDPIAEFREEAEENLCCLFGQLLGYPAVYWFDVEEGYSLDMEELVRYSVLVRGGGTKKETKGFPHMLFSFTVPSCLLDTDPELADAGSSGGVGRRIEMWYSALSSQAAQHHLQLEMRTETVTMPTVAL